MCCLNMSLQRARGNPVSAHLFLLPFQKSNLVSNPVRDYYRQFIAEGALFEASLPISGTYHSRLQGCSSTSGMHTTGEAVAFPNWEVAEESRGGRGHGYWSPVQCTENRNCVSWQNISWSMGLEQPLRD
uniref:Uncharacterized protein n=1 Tax=Micrurus surinamensis TaxID=129470 RepID=A0A2D4P6C7_MICSU